MNRLIAESGVIIDQAITTDYDLKIPLKKDGVAEKEFANYLRYLIQKGYLKGYSRPDDFDSVALTSKGFEWAQGMEIVEPEKQSGNIFPKELIKKIPNDIATVCEEFNFAYSNNKKITCMLLLRRLLPLAIVRKFQEIDKESEIKKNDEFLDTADLLGKIQRHLKEKRVYSEIMNYKLLLDISQHSYTFVPAIEDVEGAAVKLRVFLQDLFC